MDFSALVSESHSRRKWLVGFIDLWWEKSISDGKPCKSSHNFTGIISADRTFDRRLAEEEKGVRPWDDRNVNITGKNTNSFSFSLVYLPIKAPTHEQNNLNNTNTTKHIYRVPVIIYNTSNTVFCVGDAMTHHEGQNNLYHVLGVICPKYARKSCMKLWITWFWMFSP